MLNGEQRRLTGEVEDDVPEHSTAPTTGEWARLLLGAVRRRTLVAIGVFLLVAGATVAYYAFARPLYRTEAKVLAQSSRGMPSATRSSIDELPTKTAGEIIHRRESLLGIIQETNLLSGEETRRPSLWERLASRLRPPPAPSTPAAGAATPGSAPASADERLEALVSRLDKALLVSTEDDGTISLQLDWPDAVQGHAIVQAALQNFLEARHVQEVTALDDVISVTEAQAASLRQQLDRTVDQARRRSTQPAPVAAEPRPRRPSEELVRLESSLQSKQRALQDVEDFRRKRLSDLQAQLEQARTQLSDVHPTVIGLRRDIEGLSRESPQVEVLRDDVQRLQRAYNDRLAKEDYPSTARVQAPVIVPAKPDEDPAVRDARAQYEQMVGRLNAAQLEREAARAAFKYRYNVVWPPQVSREPVSPNPKKIFAAGGFAAVVLSLLAVLAPDLLSGRIFERWQVERGLGLAVLGDVRRVP